MKAKLTLLSLAALAAAAVLAVPAAADVARYQGSVLTYTLADGSTLSLVVSPCDGSFVGTETTAGVSRSVSGRIVASTITFYAGDGQPAITGAYDPVTGNFVAGTTMVGTLGSTAPTTYTNHGAFVKSVPPSLRSQAAHMCVGMPVQSHKAGNHGHPSFAPPHGNSANAPGHSSSSQSQTTSTGPSNSNGNGAVNGNGGNSGNAPGSNNGNGSDNANGGVGNGNGNGNH